MLTNDMPQSDDIVIARGGQAERCRLQTTSAVEIRMEWFDDMLPDNAEWRCQCSFAP